MSTAPKRMLVVEDSDSKFSAIEQVLLTYGALIRFQRGATIRQAEQLACSEKWDLIILDVSMDITASSSGPMRGGHATLGGIDLAEKMYLLGKDVDTIIVTAFDSFQSSDLRHGSSEILGLEDVERRAKEILHNKLLGCVRYGSEKWADALSDLLDGYFK